MAGAIAMQKRHDLIAAVPAASNRHACLLLVHRDIRLLETAAQEIEATCGWSRFSVGRELSAALLPITLHDRSYAAGRWLSSRLGQMAPGPVLCTDTGLLFEPALGLDPLALLRQASRTTRLVVTWAGTYRDGILTYAVPRHGHYRAWQRPNVAIVTLE